MLYSALTQTVTRTSTDFWPNKPESHGLHLYCNAQVSLWLASFVLPDWDMFHRAMKWALTTRQDAPYPADRFTCPISRSA
jgi:hypothetical protein